MIYLDKNLNEKNLTIIVKYMYSIIFFGQQRKQGLLLVEGRVDRPGWTRTCYVMQHRLVLNSHSSCLWLPPEWYFTFVLRLL
jgi:hypothetical protein